MFFVEYYKSKAKFLKNRAKNRFSAKKKETNNSKFIKTGGLSNEENDY